MEEDLFFNDERLKEEILRLKKEREAIILAHNYQRPEVQDIADYVGDSLGLSQQAAATDAKVIVFCGVHFMAETAYILSPQKLVLLPDLRAGCPLADMITPDALKKMKAEYPGVPVVAYVNTSAAVKAESTVCSTSANSVQIVEYLESRRVIFVPDENLGKYVARKTNKEIILWKGKCPTHHKIKRESVLRLKKDHPQAKFVAHPECRQNVLELADKICGTSGMVKYVKQDPSREFIIGTELGIIHRLKRENPSKEFYALEEAICPNMKLITLDKVYRSLKTLTPKVTVPEDIRLKALDAVQKMISIT